MELVRVRLDELRPYQNNPRYNDESVEVVEESIDQVGYITPILVDEENTILAGETRWRALNNLGEEEIEVIRLRGLSEAKKRKFRLLDNKTAELADWDLSKLIKELDDLDFGDFDFWSKELEKMGDKLLGEEEKPKRKNKPVICPRCGKVVNQDGKGLDPFIDDDEDLGLPKVWCGN